MEKFLQQKVALITGATSGIGYAIAKNLASSGVSIIFNGFGEQETIKKISTEFSELGAEKVIYCEANLAKPAEIENLFKAVKELQKIDILINNAGVQHVAPIEDFPADIWENIIRIDLIAAFYTIKYTLPLMRQNNFGRIINIASAHSLVASPFKSAYVAAKHGLLGLTKTVALEAAEHNITVNAICPGYVKTPLVENQVRDTAKARNMSEDEVIKKIILGAQATKRFVEKEEIVSLVNYLCSNEAKSITGAALSIDGGWTAQ